MTRYTVVLTTQAEQELEAAADWWSINHSRRQAREWYSGFSGVIATLRESPDRISLAIENTDFWGSTTNTVRGVTCCRE